MKYGIRLISRHTGEEVVLGHVFDTQEQREAFIEKEICLRCNHVGMVQVYPNMIWRDRHVGFVDLAIYKEHFAKHRKITLDIEHTAKRRKQKLHLGRDQMEHALSD